MKCRRYLRFIMWIIPLYDIRKCAYSGFIGRQFCHYWDLNGYRSAIFRATILPSVMQILTT